jgi:hypothetical protein
MSYFDELAEAATRLDEQGQKYLDGLPFVPNDECAKRIYVAAERVFQKAQEDWDAVPEWVAAVMDGWMPYYHERRNGSLNHLLGSSVVSRDAHLRNLLEIAEGRTAIELDFPVTAEVG